MEEVTLEWSLETSEEVAMWKSGSRGRGEFQAQGTASAKAQRSE